MYKGAIFDKMKMPHKRQHAYTARFLFKEGTPRPNQYELSNLVEEFAAAHGMQVDMRCFMSSQDT